MTEPAKTNTTAKVADAKPAAATTDATKTDAAVAAATENGKPAVAGVVQPEIVTEEAKAAAAAEEKTKAAKKVKVKEGEVAPVFALSKVTYGDHQTAVARSIFTPATEAERNELFGLKAVRELTDDEVARFERDREDANDGADDGDFG